MSHHPYNEFWTGKFLYIYICCFTAEPRVGRCVRISSVFVGCVTVNNLFHRPIAAPYYVQVSLDHNRSRYYISVSYCLFCLKFRCHGNQVGHGRICLALFKIARLRKHPNAHKHLSDISYASWVIAYLVTDFVAMAMSVHVSYLRCQRMELLIANERALNGNA